jgi:hypothetical protein
MGATVNIKGRWAVSALLNYKFDSATDAGIAGQAMFKNATYGVE